MTKKTWKDVDWVELGCRGWDIDETGAELLDPPEGDGAVFEGAVHLDFTTLDLMLHGPPDFVERAIRDLRAANALTPVWTWVGATTGSTAGSIITVYAA